MIASRAGKIAGRILLTDLLSMNFGALSAA
jgi:hypothetical protein